MDDKEQLIRYLDRINKKTPQTPVPNDQPQQKRLFTVSILNEKPYELDYQLVKRNKFPPDISKLSKWNNADFIKYILSKTKNVFIESTPSNSLLLNHLRNNLSKSIGFHLEDETHVCSNHELKDYIDYWINVVSSNKKTNVDWMCSKKSVRQYVSNYYVASNYKQTLEELILSGKFEDALLEHGIVNFYERSIKKNKVKKTLTILKETIDSLDQQRFLQVFKQLLKSYPYKIEQKFKVNFIIREAITKFDLKKWFDCDFDGKLFKTEEEIARINQKKKRDLGDQWV